MRRKLYLAAAVFILAAALRVLFPSAAAGLDRWWDAAAAEVRRAAVSAVRLLSPEETEAAFPVLRRECG